jgi:transcriptional regulator with XRE-family HTH domain
VDLTFQQIQKYEKGTNRVSCGKLWEFSKLFDVPISYFFKGIMVDESEYMYLSRLDSSEFAADEKKKTHMRDAKLNAQIVEQVERIKDANLKESILSFIRSFTRHLAE